MGADPCPAAIRSAREAAGLSARQAAELVGVTTVTWQRWEGQTARKTKMPAACWELFLLKTRRSCHSRSQG